MASPSSVQPTRRGKAADRVGGGAGSTIIATGCGRSGPVSTRTRPRCWMISGTNQHFHDPESYPRLMGQREFGSRCRPGVGVKGTFQPEGVLMTYGTFRNCIGSLNGSRSRSVLAVHRGRALAACKNSEPVRPGVKQ